MNDQSSIALGLQVALGGLFPDSYVVARIRNILGENIYVTYANGNGPAEWSNGIIENDPAFMRFAILTNKDGTAYIEAPCTHRRLPVKFRKINAANEVEAGQKLMAWFTKNQMEILALGKN